MNSNPERYWFRRACRSGLSQRGWILQYGLHPTRFRGLISRGPALLALLMLLVPNAYGTNPLLDVGEVDLPDRKGLGCLRMMSGSWDGGASKTLVEFGTTHPGFGGSTVGFSFIHGLHTQEYRRSHQHYGSVYLAHAVDMSNTEPPFVAWLGKTDGPLLSRHLEVFHGPTLTQRTLTEFDFLANETTHFRIVEASGPQDFTYVRVSFNLLEYFHSASDEPLWSQSIDDVLSAEPVRLSEEQTVLAVSTPDEIRILDSKSGMPLDVLAFTGAERLFTTRLLPGEAEQLVAVGTDFSIPPPPDSGSIAAFDVDGSSTLWVQAGLQVVGASAHDNDGDGIDELLVVRDMGDDPFRIERWSAGGVLIEGGNLEGRADLPVIGVSDVEDGGQPEVLVSADCESGIQALSNDLSEILKSGQVMDADFSRLRVWSPDSGTEVIYSLGKVPASPASSPPIPVLRASDSGSGQLLWRMPLDLSPAFEVLDLAVRPLADSTGHQLFAAGEAGLTPHVARINPQSREVEAQRMLAELDLYTIRTMEVADFHGNGEKQVLLVSEPLVGSSKHNLRYHFLDPQTLEITDSSDSLLAGGTVRPPLLDVAEGIDDGAMRLLITTPGQATREIQPDTGETGFVLQGPISDARYIRDANGQELIVLYQGGLIDQLQFYDAQTGALIDSAPLDAEIHAIYRQHPETLLLASRQHLHRFSMYSMNITTTSRRLGPRTGYSGGFRPSQTAEGRVLIGNQAGIWSVAMPPDELLFNDGFEAP